MLRSARLRRERGLGACYVAVHNRHRQALADLPCVGCDSLRAVEAALRHNAIGPLRADPYGRNAGVLFSDDLADYVPLCRSCHGAYDTGRPPSRALRVRSRIDGTIDQTTLDDLACTDDCDDAIAICAECGEPFEVPAPFRGTDSQLATWCMDCGRRANPYPPEEAA
jgi:hypothetical protein